MRMLLDTKILNYKGEEIIGDEDNKPLTFFDVFATALNVISKGAPLTAEKKSQIYQLTRKLYTTKEPNLTVNELALIKERVGEVYNPLVYGRVCDFIDGTKDETPAADVTPPATPQQEATA